MILDDVVRVRTRGDLIKYYQELGYDCGYDTEIYVKIEDLSDNSHIRVNVLCDMCKKETMNVEYRLFVRRMKETGSYVCKDCAKIKREQTVLSKYGVTNAMYLDTIKEKMKQTTLLRYGVENVMFCDEFKEKIKETSMKRYGTPNAMQNHLIRQKAEETNLLRYGHKYAFCSNEIREKYRQTMLERYGVENVYEIPNAREKIAQGLYRNHTQKVSYQQEYLCDLFNGELNYPISKYNADICFPFEKTIVEYNGGGHALNVLIGKETEDEHKQKEIQRFYIIKRAGYKQIIITSSNDYLPSDDVLIRMLEEAKEYFNSTVHTWVEYDIDKSIMRNAVNKDGIHYDFGVLRKIKRTA